MGRVPITWDVFKLEFKKKYILIVVQVGRQWSLYS